VTTLASKPTPFGVTRPGEYPWPIMLVESLLAIACGALGFFETPGLWSTGIPTGVYSGLLLMGLLGLLALIETSQRGWKALWGSCLVAGAASAMTLPLTRASFTRLAFIDISSDATVRVAFSTSLVLAAGVLFIVAGIGQAVAARKGAGSGRMALGVFALAAAMRPLWYAAIVAAPALVGSMASIYAQAIWEIVVMVAGAVMCVCGLVALVTSLRAPLHRRSSSTDTHST
jgi:hypothetical protein